MKDIFENKNLATAEKIQTLYMNSLDKYPPLSREEEKILCLKIQDGDEKAFSTLVMHNLRFVVRVAKQYTNQGVPFIDLIEAGTLGLLYSARKYDYNEETKFISYAVWGIKHSIQRELASMSRTFRIPTRVVAKIQKLLKRVADGETLIGTDALFYLNMLPTSSLDSPISVTDDEVQTDSLTDMLSKDINEGEIKVDQEEITNILKEEITRTLNDQEKIVVNEYFGFIFEDIKTLEEIGTEMSISRERVRIIKDRALNKLKRSKLIRTYFKDNRADLGGIYES